MTMPEVSVIIPTRNRRRFLGRAIRSALFQTGVELEVLVVDDGSTDGTEEMLSSVQNARLRYLRNAVPVGVGAARNIGISRANGRWIAFLDDDDVWAPTKVAQQVEAMVTNRKSWSYAGDVMVDEALNILSGGPPPPPDDVVRLLHRHNSVPAGASNVLVAADALAAAGPFDPELTTSEDWDMWIRLARIGPPEWVCRPLVAISYHDRNTSRDVATMIRQLDVVAGRYGVPIDRARHYRWAAWHALLEGRRADATRYYARAVTAGDVRSVARAAVAIAWPEYATRRARIDGRAAESDQWIAEAREWLEQLARSDGGA
jgi:glycosyltransferase involved in cell wall biosynthesis